MVLTATGTDGLSRLTARYVDFHIDDAPPLRLGEDLHARVDVQQSAPLVWRERLERLPAPLGRYDVRSTAVGGYVAESSRDGEQSVGRACARGAARSELLQYRSGLEEGVRIDGILDFELHLLWGTAGQHHPSSRYCC